MFALYLIAQKVKEDLAHLQSKFTTQLNRTNNSRSNTSESASPTDEAPTTEKWKMQVATQLAKTTGSAVMTAADRAHVWETDRMEFPYYNVLTPREQEALHNGEVARCMFVCTACCFVCVMYLILHRVSQLSHDHRRLSFKLPVVPYAMCFVVFRLPNQLRTLSLNTPLRLPTGITLQLDFMCSLS